MGNVTGNVVAHKQKKKKKCNFATLEERRKKKMQLKMRVFV